MPYLRVLQWDLVNIFIDLPLVRGRIHTQIATQNVIVTFLQKPTHSTLEMCGKDKIPTILSILIFFTSAFLDQLTSRSSDLVLHCIQWSTKSEDSHPCFKNSPSLDSRGNLGMDSTPYGFHRDKYFEVFYHCVLNWHVILSDRNLFVGIFLAFSYILSCFGCELLWDMVFLLTMAANIVFVYIFFTTCVAESAKGCIKIIF